MFSLIRPFIFGLDPEVAHDLAIKSFQIECLIPDKFFKVENEEMLETKFSITKLETPLVWRLALIKVLKYLIHFSN